VVFFSLDRKGSRSTLINLLKHINSDGESKMKRFFLALLLCFISVSVIATQAIAAKPGSLSDRQADYGENLYSSSTLPSGLTKVEAAVTVRTATCVVAAANAPPNEKAQADYVCTGTADQSVINSAILAASSGGGGVVKLSSGNFYINGTINLLVNTSLTGNGITETNINLANNSNVTMIQCTQPSTFIMGSVISELHLYGNRASQTAGDGIVLTYNPSGINQVDDILIEHVFCQNMYRYGIYVNAGWGIRIINSLCETCGSDGFRITGQEIYMSNNFSSINLGHGFNVGTLNCSTLANNQAFQNSLCGFLTNGATYNVTFTSNLATLNGQHGYHVDSSPRLTFTGNAAYSNSQSAANTYHNYFLNSAYDCTFTGNTAIDTQDKVQCGFYLFWGGPNSLVNNLIDGGNYAIGIAPSTYMATLIGNSIFKPRTAAVYTNSYISVWQGNLGFIAPGEIRTVSGAIPATGVNTSAVSLLNPYGQSVRVKSVDVYISSAASSASSVDVGIGPSGGDSTGLWTKLDVNSKTGYFMSTIAPGTQTVPVGWGPTSYFNIYTTATGATTGLAATYTITVMGN
jgi:hypothetical protein